VPLPGGRERASDRLLSRTGRAFASKSFVEAGAQLGSQHSISMLFGLEKAQARA
jgi:hypothetical protein